MVCNIGVLSIEVAFIIIFSTYSTTGMKALILRILFTVTTFSLSCGELTVSL